MNKLFLKMSMVFFLLLVSFTTFADDEWREENARLQCGVADLEVKAFCKRNPSDNTLNICKSYSLIIKSGNVLKSYSLPYISDDQRLALQKEGYKFNNIISPGEWVPQTINCISDKYIGVNYTTGINDEENVNQSLTLNTSAPFFDLKGFFITGEIEQKLRLQYMKDDSNSVYVNFLEKSSEE